MNRKELENRLNYAKIEIDNFFEESFENNFSDKMINYINRKESSLKSKRRKYISKKYKVVFISFIIIFTLAISAKLLLPSFYIKKLNNSIFQEIVVLKDSSDKYFANYYRIKNSKPNNNLLAVFSMEDTLGNIDVLYSGIMEETITPKPIEMLNTPYSDLLLLSSVNEKDNFMHYRILKLKDNKVSPLLEENYVMNGEITTSKGAFIEKRTHYTNSIIDKLKTTQSIIVPVLLNNNGDLTLTTNQITMNLGDNLILLLDDSLDMLEVETNNKYLLETSSSNNDYKGSYLYYTANKVGSVNLIVTIDNSKKEKLYVEIIE